MEKTIEKTPTKKIKKMTLVNVIIAMFTSMFLIDSLVPAASTGASTIIWYLILAVAFYIPYALVTGELSSKIPDEGGIYIWVKKTLGIGTAKRVAWYYWVNVGIWVPSIAIYMAQLIQFMWFSGTSPNADDMYNYPWITMTIAIVFMWLSLGFAYFPIADNTKIYTSSTICKIIIILFLIIAMFSSIGRGQASKTDFSQISKEFSDVGTLIMFLPALVYNALGLEAIAGEASNIKNPKKTMAKASLITMLLLILFYICSTLAIQYVFDTANGFDLSGIMQGFINSFGISEVGSQILFNILGLLFLWSMFVETMGWVSGANAGIAESAENKEIPAIFKWRNKRDMPFKSTLLIGFIGTIELIMFTSIAYSQDQTISGMLFWSLFAASSNILFLSYMIMFIGYIKGKWTNQLDKYEGFSLKKWVGIIWASIALFVMTTTYILLLWSPGYNLLEQTLPIVLSVVLSMLAGEMCFLLANKKYRNGWINNIKKERI